MFFKPSFLFATCLFLSHGLLFGGASAEGKEGQKKTWKYNVTGEELRALGQALFALEGTNANNAGPFVQWNLQGRSCPSCDGDNAPSPLLSVHPRAFKEKGTLALLLPLFDNYEANVSVPEDVTEEERGEEGAFLDAIWGTEILTRLRSFLQGKGVPFSKESFREMWFGLYPRGGGRRKGGGGPLVKGSSGFEHVFLGEIKGGVSGFHGWAFFAQEEERKRVNYRGWVKFTELGNKKGAILQLTFDWRGRKKGLSSMFLATSPEFEMAVFTACWLTRPNSPNCPLSFASSKVSVTTYAIGDKVASAFVVI